MSNEDCDDIRYVMWVWSGNVEGVDETGLRVEAMDGHWDHDIRECGVLSGPPSRDPLDPQVYADGSKQSECEWSLVGPHSRTGGSTVARVRC